MQGVGGFLILSFFVCFSLSFGLVPQSHQLDWFQLLGLSVYPRPDPVITVCVRVSAWVCRTSCNKSDVAADVGWVLRAGLLFGVGIREIQGSFRSFVDCCPSGTRVGGFIVRAVLANVGDSLCSCTCDNEV